MPHWAYLLLGMALGGIGVWIAILFWIYLRWPRG
jgi:hypothetical protein